MKFPLPLLLISVLSFCAPSTLARSSWSEDPCRSGLEPGQRPGPYSFVLSTGPQRGQSYCYICETAERPAVVVFARTLNDQLARLVQQLDQTVSENKKADLRAWITFLNPDQLAFDPKIVQWGQKHAIRNVPLGVFEDVNGPPSYRLARDAEVTVLLFVKQKVVVNFAFRTGELAEDKIAEVIKAVPRLTEHMR